MTDNRIGRSSVESTETHALALVRDGLAAIDVSTASLHDWRRLRELVAVVREAQRFRHERVRARIRARLDAERRRLLRARAENAELRLEMIALRQKGAELDAESRRLQAERFDATVRRLSGAGRTEDV